MATETDDARRAGRERLRALLGLAALQVSEPARIEPATSQVPAAGDCRMVDIVAGDDPSIPAFLLRPSPEVDSGAAVVLISGHGRGIDDLVRQDPGDEYHGAVAHKFVRAGWTVLAPEMVSFGRRRVPRPEGADAYEPGESSCGIDAARFLLRGTTVLGRRVADATAAVTALAALPGVDPRRIAVAGGSGGGAVSLLTAATHEAVRGALVANYFSSFEASLCSVRHCPCNIVPGVLPGLEMADIATLIAPRHLVIETGESDPLFPVEAARSAFSRLEPIWKKLGASAPELVVTSSGHRWEAERSLRLLTARLGD